MNQFGRMLRQERKERNMSLGDVAHKLNISVPYLSQIETGVKPLQDGFVDTIIKTFEMIGDDANKLRRAAAASQTEFKFKLKSNANVEDKVLASELANCFARLSPDAKSRLREIIKDEHRG